jgi:CBS domain-containing protein
MPLKNRSAPLGCSTAQRAGTRNWLVRIVSECKLAFELARKNVVTCRPDEGLGVIAKRMVDHWISSVVVVDKKKPIGIVTDGVIFRVIADGRNPLMLQAKDVMVKPVLTVHPNITISDAEEWFLKTKVSRLVFVDNEGKLIGIVSKKDIDRFAAYSLAERLRLRRV